MKFIEPDAPAIETKPLASTVKSDELKWATPFFVLSDATTAFVRWISMVNELAAKEFVRMTFVPTTPLATCAPVIVNIPVPLGKTGSVPGAVAASTFIDSTACPNVDEIVTVFPDALVVIFEPPKISKTLNKGTAVPESVTKDVGI
jgi:hypothetical protein